ncbi:MAG: VWA domain-containing protein [Myxococcales bacterium]|nr:VWA domain-containing protein [Myxococcales bacterium]
MNASKWLWICGLSLTMPFTACKQLSPQPDPHPPVRSGSTKLVSAESPHQKDAKKDYDIQENTAPKGYKIQTASGWTTVLRQSSAHHRQEGGFFGKGGASLGRVDAARPKSKRMHRSRAKSVTLSTKESFEAPAARIAADIPMRRSPPKPSLGMGPKVAEDVADSKPEARVDTATVAKNTPVIAQPALKAGETNDNINFDAYLEYYHKNKHLLPAAYQIDVTERYTIEALDQDGRNLPNCRVVVTDEADRVLWKGRTDAFGKMHFFPRTTHKDTKTKQFIVSYLYQGKSFVRTYPRSKTGSLKPWKVTLPVKKQIDKVRLDLLFLLDTTGSMGDEIARIQQTLLAITAKINNQKKEYELRYGMVLYRDRTDEYITRSFPFTQDVQAFDKALKEVNAAGGGDSPEAMNMGLYAAVEKMKWTPAALRLVFLVADAPPHMDYGDDVPYTKTLQTAVAKGIKIYPTAASGLDPQGTFVMRQIAQFTNANFLFIEYGKGTAGSHGITTPHESNNLDDIIVRIVQKELKAYAQ